jgi:hypothetical protein
MADAATRKTLLRGTTLGMGLLLALALLVLVNYFGFKYHARFDWTESQIYSLSDKTLNLIENRLGEPVEVTVFFVPTGSAADQLYEPLRELLARYEAASPNISVAFLDPVKRPLEAQAAAERFGLGAESVVVFATDDDRRVVPVSELADFDFGGIEFGAAPDVAAFKGEQELTSALLDLVEQRRPKVLFTTGHGERSLDDLGGEGLSLLRRLLERDNFEVEEWAPLGKDAVPENTDVIVIAGATATFLEPELDLFRRYAAAGGRFLVLLEPTLASEGEWLETGLESWLRELGIDVGRDVVLDPESPLPFFGAESLFVNSYGDTPPTRSLSDENLPVLMTLSRSVGARAAAGGGVTEALFTSAAGWGETDTAALFAGEADPGDDDTPGPVSLGVTVIGGGGGRDEMAEGDGVDGEMEPVVGPAGAGGAGLRMMVTGDSDWAASRLLQGNLGNQVLLGDTMNWLVERETLLGIPAKEPEQVRLALSSDEMAWIWLLVLLVLPSAAVVLGGVLFWRRRR